MNIDTMRQSLFDGMKDFVTEPNMFRSVVILIAAIVLAYFLSKYLANFIVWIAQKVASRGDKETDDQRNLRYRQIETYLSIAVAVVRVLVTVFVAFEAWSMLNPLQGGDKQAASNSLAAIGAGTIFILFAGQTIGLVLRDLTVGSIMITEGWFHVGDFIKVEPFWELSGVVERFTLRSTRIRALNGEIIWIHNQHITAVRVTPKGVRTMAVEVFLRDKDKGRAAIERLIETMPTGKTMLARPLVIEHIEAWTDDTWHLTVTGQTPPGREWLIEEYFFESVKSLDDDKPKSARLLARPPMVHMADSTADKRFKRAVRVTPK